MFFCQWNCLEEELVLLLGHHWVQNPSIWRILIRLSSRFVCKETPDYLYHLVPPPCCRVHSHRYKPAYVLGYRHGFRVFDFGLHKFWIEYYGVDKQVGLVLSVSDHPISEKLYVCKVEVAPGETRQVSILFCFSRKKRFTEFSNINSCVHPEPDAQELETFSP